MNRCFINSLAISLPETILTNQELEKMVDTSDEWIRARTGIERRRVLAKDENSSTLAIDAAKNALSKAKTKSDDLTHIIVCTCTPEYLTPSMACLIDGAIARNSTKPLIAFDMNAACAGFVYGIEMIRSFFALHHDSQILFVTAEALSRRLNYQDRSTCVLFGDGAAAMSISSKPIEGMPQFEILDSLCYSDGVLKDLIVIGGGTSLISQVGDSIKDDFFLQMQGREVYKNAIRSMSSSCLAMLSKHNLTLEDIALVVPHQANMRIIESVYDRLGVKEHQRFLNVQNYGNTSASSIPLALFDLIEAKRVHKNDIILITTFGGGLTWGSVLLKVV